MYRSWNDTIFTLDEAAHAAKALSTSPWLADRMLKAGAVDMLVCCKYWQRGLSEAQNGYGLCMLPGHGLRDGALSSLVLDDSPVCKLLST